MGGQNLEVPCKYAMTFEGSYLDFVKNSPEIFSIPKEPKSHNSDAFGTPKLMRRLLNRMTDPNRPP